jgi:hypothetical protein
MADSVEGRNADSRPTRCCRNDAIHGLQEALKVDEIVCEAAGSVALYASSPFDRRRRDLITMSNHIIGQHKTRATMGQLLFGEAVVMSPYKGASWI